MQQSLIYACAIVNGRNILKALVKEEDGVRPTEYDLKIGGTGFEKPSVAGFADIMVRSRAGGGATPFFLAPMVSVGIIHEFGGWHA